MKIKDIVFSCFILMLSCQAYAQCNSDLFKDKGIRLLNETSGFTYLKSYKIDGPNKSYSYIFSKGSEYMITLANQDRRNRGFYLKIYDSNKKEVASSLQGGEYFSAIRFSCQNTGIYHMQFSFDNSNDTCAAGILGVKR